MRRKNLQTMTNELQAASDALVKTKMEGIYKLILSAIHISNSYQHYGLYKSNSNQIFSCTKCKLIEINDMSSIYNKIPMILLIYDESGLRYNFVVQSCSVALKKCTRP